MSERNKLGVVRVVVVVVEEEEEEYAFVFVGVRSSITSSERKRSGRSRRDGTTDARIIVLFFSSSGEAPHQSEGEKRDVFLGRDFISLISSLVWCSTHTAYLRIREQREIENKRKRDTDGGDECCCWWS